MLPSSILHHPSIRYALALFAGYLLHFGFAPYYIWPAAILSPSLFSILLYKEKTPYAFRLAFLYGLGLFGGGVSWVYVSIHDYGNTSALPAALMTASFVAFLALVNSIPFALYSRFLSKSKLALLFAFPAAWVLGEWIRTWFLTGFPWLFVGYAHTETSLSGWAPLGGVLLLSFLSILTGQIAVYLGAKLRSREQFNSTKYTRAAFLLAIVTVVWFAGATLKNKPWTQVSEEDLSVAIVQPNIPLFDKWDSNKHEEIANVLGDFARQNWTTDIQLWPEAAIPSLYSLALPFINDLDHSAKDKNNAIVSGVLYNTESGAIYNSIIGLGSAEGIYHKQRLVPFGEYVPLEKQLRGLIEFFNLPSSIIERGPKLKNPIVAQSKSKTHYSIAPFICYEVVYPDLVAKMAKNASVLVTISNDAWFGYSAGPLQHFQMARMRAIEHRKYLVRATNTGLSGIVDPYGNTTLSGSQFSRENLRGTIKIAKGSTPFSSLDSLPILIICILALLSCHLIQKRRDKRHLNGRVESE